MKLARFLSYKAFAQTVIPNTTSLTVNDLIANALTKYIIPMAAALAVGVIIYGGVQYITSGGDPEKTAKAKKTLLWAIVSVIIIVLTIPIVNAVMNILKDKII